MRRDAGGWIYIVNEVWLANCSSCVSHGLRTINYPRDRNKFHSSSIECSIDLRQQYLLALSRQIAPCIVTSSIGIVANLHQTLHLWVIKDIYITTCNFMSQTMNQVQVLLQSSALKLLQSTLNMPSIYLQNAPDVIAFLCLSLLLRFSSQMSSLLVM